MTGPYSPFQDPGLPTHILYYYLQKAEQTFGPRNKDWKIGGVLLRPNMPPELFGVLPARSLIINVSIAPEQHFERFVFQLSHEVVHMLSPTTVPHASLFEEGLAVWFSLRCVSKQYGDGCVAGLEEPYRTALALIQKISPDPARLIALRQKQPNLDAITPELITKHFGASTEDATKLCERR